MTESTSTLAQALENEKNGLAKDEDAKSTSQSTSSKARRRRWFGSSKSVSDKSSNSTPTGATSSSNTSIFTTTPNSSVSNHGKITSATNHSPSDKTASRPINIQSSSSSRSHKPSSYSSHSSWGHDGSLHGSSVSDTLNVRDKEIVDAQDRLDRWGARATGGTERVEREMGLSDEMNMGLS